MKTKWLHMNTMKQNNTTWIQEEYNMNTKWVHNGYILITYRGQVEYIEKTTQRHVEYTWIQTIYDMNTKWIHAYVIETEPMHHGYIKNA